MKIMLVALALVLNLTVCGQPQTEGNTQAPVSAAQDESSANTGADSGSAILVAYFSATGTTKVLAEHAADILHADLYEIVPETPYTAGDLDYNDRGSRTSIEQNDSGARPAISGSVENMGQYDTVVIAHPIWWGQAPRIISTFLESYDFSGKTITTFVTSGSSSIGSSQINLHGLCDASVTWIDGTRFSGSASREDVAAWLNQIGILAKSTESNENTMMIRVGDTVLTASLADNSSTDALRELLKNGPITIDMEDYGNFEKVGPLGTDLPRHDEPITTGPGDLILYQGNRFVIYYDTNSWTFTRLGKIENVAGEELGKILGGGDVTITLSLE